MTNKDILKLLSIEPQATKDLNLGTEPNIFELIQYYYRDYFDEDQTEKLVNEYVDLLIEQFNKETEK